MAQRTVALCDGKFIGIETIYTVIDDKQINIPEKINDLREKSRKDKLFCPCGCGSNLIMVAGDKNLREQHFRMKDGIGSQDCHMPIEGKTSIDSKIVMKCWLDDKLKASDIESRVPIDTVEKTARKPEFTFLSREKKFAIRYWRERVNIINDRVEVLEANVSGIKTLYIVDASNDGCDGQYPEALMKIQDKQGYCLLLSIKEAEYDKAFMKAVFYAKDIDGLYDGFRTSINYSPVQGTTKEVVFYIGEHLEGAVNIQQEEIQDYKWLDYRRAFEVLTYDTERKVLAEANEYIC